ncbi:MAG: hypothetical protein WBP26_06035 [Candidatus Saccharimonadales bacterium]
MTSSQERPDSTPGKPDDITTTAREAALANMGLPPADIRAMLGQNALLQPSGTEPNTTVVGLKPNYRGRGRALPSDTELDPDFAPPVAEVLARPVLSGPSAHDVQELDRLLAWADWSKALRRAGGNTDRARAYAMAPRGHVAKGNPKV